MTRRNPSHPEQPTGSPAPGEPVFLVVGKLRRPHGVRGEILMEIITDFPERIQAGARLYLGSDHQPVTVRSARPHGRGLIVDLQECGSQEAAAELRNQMVYVTAADRPPLPEGEYYHHQLLGLRVVAEDGSLLGELVSILDNPANDVYVVRRPNGAELLLPAIQDVILEIDLEQGQIRAHLLPGLLDE